MGSSGERRQRVEVIWDPHDDRRLHDAIRRKCRRRRDTLAVLVPPDPSAHGQPLPQWVLLTVYQALGEPTRPTHEELLGRLRHPTQLALFLETDVEGGRPESARQLPLFPEMALAEEIGRCQGLARSLWLQEVSDMLVTAGIRELYVLGARLLGPRTWGWLCELAHSSSVQLHLVVAGRRPRPAQLQALQGCRVRRRLATPVGRDLAPWWSTPSYAASRRRRATALPERFVRLTRRRGRPPTRAEPAVPPAVVTGTAVWERLREAARTLVPEGGGGSYLLLLPPVLDPDVPVVEEEQLVAAFRGMLARLAEREPLLGPGAGTSPRPGREVDQER